MPWLPFAISLDKELCLSIYAVMATAILLFSFPSCIKRMNFHKHQQPKHSSPKRAEVTGKQGEVSICQLIMRSEEVQVYQ